MIKNFKIDFGGYKFKNIHGNENTDITDLSKVNIFIGPNNSGKSRFMRSLFDNKNIIYTDDSFNIKKFNEVVKQIKNIVISGTSVGNPKHQNYPEIEPLVNLLRHIRYSNKEEFDNCINRVVGLINYLKTRRDQRGTMSGDDRIKQALSINILQKIEATNIYNLFDELGKVEFKKYEKIYIPILRGLRPVNLINDEPIRGKNSQEIFNDLDVYATRAEIDYFLKKDVEGKFQDLNKKTKFEIFTGLSIYNQIKKMLLGDKNQREFIRAFENFLKKEFFHEDITLVPNIKDDVLYITIGDEDDRPIYKLGDGLQTIIINTFPLFKYKKENILLFIEEPEITLHPGLQRRLIEVFCNKFSNAQIFITTHSNHLLDTTLDHNNCISFYSVTKKSKEDFEVKNITQNKKILDLLGVRNSSVFLSNCVVWVEGISDRLYINKFLDLYLKKINEKQIEEDKHYSILEYGGGNITHFNFDDISENERVMNMKAINQNNYIVADNDLYSLVTGKNKETGKVDDKGKRLKTFNENFKDNFFAEHIEIENLIPFDVYKKYFENLKPNGKRVYEYINEDGNKAEFNRDVKKDRIGNVLKKHLVKLKEGKSGEAFTKSYDITCIGQKKDIAIELIKTIDEMKLTFDKLPLTARRLTEDIYKFIQKNNS